MLFFWLEKIETKVFTFWSETVVRVGPSFSSEQFDDDEDNGQEDDEGQAEADDQGKVGGGHRRRGLSHRFGAIENDRMETHWSKTNMSWKMMNNINNKRVVLIK